MTFSFGLLVVRLAVVVVAGVLLMASLLRVGPVLEDKHDSLNLPAPLVLLVELPLFLG